MSQERPHSVSELVPPALRSLPRMHFDSSTDGELKGSRVHRTFALRGRIRNVISSLKLPHGSLAAVQSAHACRFEILLEKDTFLLRFHLGGHFDYRADGATFCDEPDLLLSPGTHVAARSRDMGILLVGLRQRALARALGTASCPGVGMRSLNKHGGPHLRAMALAAANEAEQMNEDLRPAFLRNFENTFACAVGSVLMQFAPDFRRPDPMIGRRKVDELREWAALDHAEPITVGDLAARCGLGLRALQKNFLLHFDTTPMLYLRELRLQKARRLLQEHTAGLSVTAAALEAGFAHLGRFSATYRERFGELPSETLSRALGL